MTPLAQSVTTILSLGIIFLNVITVFLFALVIGRYFSKEKRDKTAGIGPFVSRHSLAISFCTAFVAALGSFIYSNIIGFAPCELCWWQRIFLYPQVIIFGLGLYYSVKTKIHEKIFFIISLTLSIIGGLIALYHYYGQSFQPDILPVCVAQGVSCAKLYFVTFGYVTLPLMALSVFVFLISIFCIRRTFHIE